MESRPAHEAATQPEVPAESPRWAVIAFAVVMVGVAAYAVISGVQLGYWVELGPGPGFFPLWIGVLIALGSVAWTAEKLRASPTNTPRADPDQAERAGATWIDRYRIWIVLASLITLAAALNGVGFQTTMFLFLILHLKVLGGRGWILSLVIAAAGSFGVFHLFWDLLQIPLPRSNILPLYVMGL